MPEVPSFFTKEFGSEVPKELVAPLGAADEALKCLWSTLREVGFSVEHGFKVRATSLVVAPGTKYGYSLGAVLVSFCACLGVFGLM